MKKRRSRKKKKNYSRIQLDGYQRDFLREVRNDPGYINGLNKVYFHTLANALDTGSYSEAPIVKRNLTTICKEYVKYKEENYS